MLHFLRVLLCLIPINGAFCRWLLDSHRITQLTWAQSQPRALPGHRLPQAAAAEGAGSGSQCRGRSAGVPVRPHTPAGRHTPPVSPGLPDLAAFPGRRPGPCISPLFLHE